MKAIVNVGQWSSKESTFPVPMHLQCQGVPKCVRYSLCDGIPGEQAVRLDLSFFPDDFFDPRCHEELLNHYNEMVFRPRIEKGTFSNMQHKSSEHGAANFRFPGDERNTKIFADILEYFAVKFGGKEKDSKFSIYKEWKLGWLSTVLETQQDPHLDYKHCQLNYWKKKSQILPWSFGMGMTEGGMRLAFYGSCDSENTPLVPVEMQVPWKSLLMWRGDCIHAGGLLDMNCKSGFRMHGYLPLHRYHTGCGGIGASSIEWEKPGKPLGDRYSKRFKRLDGTSFVDEEDAMYAIDVAERLKLPRTKHLKIDKSQQFRKPRESGKGRCGEEKLGKKQKPSH